MLIFERDEKYGFTASDDSLANVGGLSHLVLRLLRARGATAPEDIEAFIHPTLELLNDPMLFKDMDKATVRIEKAIAGGELICIFGDYDTDGICATAILARYLKSRGAKVGYHIPLRHEHGYGMSEDAVRLLADKGVNLIITVDNGIAASNEIKLCYRLGMDVIVTDHHRCQGDIPQCEAVICHSRPDNTYPNTALCGAGVALKVVHALGGYDAMLPLIPLAGLATIADIVPLTGENRVLAKHTIDALNSGDCIVGLKALGSEARTCECDTGYNSRKLSFGMIPRLNAAGRMKDAKPGVTLLLTNDEDEAKSIAETLSELNCLRKEEEQRIYDDAVARIESGDITDDRIIMMYSPEWNVGVIGIAASRICERYHRPTLLFTQTGDTLTGSARSIAGVDIFDALNANSRFFTRFGGHARAAGANMLVSDFEECRSSINDYIRQSVPDDTFIPKQRYELDVELSDMTVQLAEEIDRLAPFGEGNPMPVFYTGGVKLRSLKRVGSDGAHLKALVQKGAVTCDSVAYCKGHLFDSLLAADRCRILFTPCANAWKGQKQLQLKIKAVCAERIDDTNAYIDAIGDKFYDAFYKNAVYNDTPSAVRRSCVDRLECLKRLILSDICGTLVLCFTQEGTHAFIEDMTRIGAWDRADIFVSRLDKKPIAYNAAVFAPVLDEIDASYYKNILVYDTAFSLGALERLHSAAPKASVVTADMPAARYELEKVASVDRARMGVMFNAMRSCIRCGKKRPADIIDRISEMCGRHRSECAFALDVFTELGFIRTDSGGNVSVAINAPQRTLCESARYRGAVNLKKAMAEYENAKA